MKECHEGSKDNVVASDGNTIRGSYDKLKRKGLIHMVSVVNQVVLSLVKTSEKDSK